MLSERINLFSAVYVKTKLPDHLFQLIKEEVSHIQRNFDKSTRYNDQLAGSLSHSFQVANNIPNFEGFLNQQAKSYIKGFGDVAANREHAIVRREDNGLDMWVNFQKKYEFNPPHVHAGNGLSFVVWIKVPFLINDEQSLPHVKDSTTKEAAAAFNFFVPNFAAAGGVGITSLPVDKTWEGHMIIFPTSLIHSVNPFYTSDEYRISLAGNLTIV